MPITGFNCGLLISISRCLALNDYKGIQNSMKMHFWFMRIFVIVMIVISCMYAYAVGWIYKDEVLSWTRVEIILNIPIGILMFYNDSYRNLYIAWDQKSLCVFFEAITLV